MQNITGFFVIFQNFPIFWEFVQYLKTLSWWEMDEHWVPISVYCSVCQFQYKSILHFENLTQESQYFLETMFPENGSRLANSALAGVRNATSDNLVRDMYFQKQLDQDDVDFLYHLYISDFKLFQYEKL